MEQQKPKWIKFNGDERSNLKKGEWYKVVFFNTFSGAFTINNQDGQNIECKSYEAQDVKYDEYN